MKMEIRGLIFQISIWKGNKKTQMNCRVCIHDSTQEIIFLSNEKMKEILFSVLLLHKGFFRRGHTKSTLLFEQNLWYDFISNV